MRSSSRSKSSLNISHRNTTSATFEMTYKFQKKSKKSIFFITSTYSIPTFTIKILANFFTFDPPSEVSKIAEGYVYFFENYVHMRIEGAWRMASCSREE
jgi:hypothetical protein